MTTACHCIGHSERYSTCKASLVSAKLASESRSAKALQTSCDLQNAMRYSQREEVQDDGVTPSANWLSELQQIARLK